MEALRFSLVAPMTNTILMTFGVAHAMKEMIKIRYACKDEEGKLLLPHPYAPWEKVDPKYQDQVDSAYRAFKMFENVKEWAFLCLPPMWIVALNGSALPYVSNDIMDAITVLSGGVYCVATYMYIQGYLTSATDRLRGFQIRTKVAAFWLYGSGLSTAWVALQKFGLV
eukprot:Nitzschia sp. Nitz4//scaffold7_size249615//228970//229473//NITZ4_001215-RA/size249615-processed-gene-0.164-mRNA-1//1//CDS//3329558556//2897//frame0